MNWIKAGCAGLIGSLLILVVFIIGINVTGVAPFNLPPSAAFLAAIGIPPKPLALVVHFSYGFAWAVILYALFRERVSVINGMGVAFAQWLLFMIVYTPIIGWGVFGFGGAGHTLPPDAPLHLGNPVKYLVLTLVLHLIYGAINGWLIPRWTAPKTRVESAA